MGSNGAHLDHSPDYGYVHEASEPKGFEGTKDYTTHGGTFANVGGDTFGSTHVAQRIVLTGHGANEIDDIHEVLRWLTPINSQTQQEEALSKRLPGTGSWFLRAPVFQEWILKDDSTIWGKGIPATGKTILTAIANDYLQSQHPGVPVLVFYFRDDIEYLVEDVIASLLKQLLIQYGDGILPVWVEEYEQYRRDDRRPSELILLGWLHSALSHFPKVFITLDALDEMRSDRRKLRLLKLLASMHRNILIVSRPLEPMEQCVPQATLFPIRSTDRDMDTFIQSRVDQHPNLSRLLARDDTKAEIVMKIRSSSGGMFLIADLQVEALTDCSNISNLRTSLDGLPSSTSDVYHKTWTRVLAQPAKWMALAKGTIVWLTQAAEPLTVPLLREALAMNGETGEFDPSQLIDEGLSSLLVTMCCGLITVDRQTSVVRFIHRTAQDFFLEQVRVADGAPQFVASACIGYLLHSGFNKLIFKNCHDQRLPHSPFIPSNMEVHCQKNVQEFLEQSDHPLLAYAYRHWGFHARRSCETGQLPQIVFDFLRQTPKYPLEVSSDAESESCTPYDLGTPIHVAAQYGLTDVLDVLSFNNEVTSHRQRTPLHLASFHNHKSFVQHIISSTDLDINSRDALMDSSLSLAAARGSEDIVRVLLKSPGVSTNLRDARGRSALLKASAWGHVGCTQLLLDHPNVDPNDQDDWGRSSLMKAATWGQSECVKLLLDNTKVDLNLRDRRGETALMHASSRGNVEVVELLLSHARHGSKSKETPSGMPASEWSDRPRREPLDINARSDLGLTALMKATFCGRIHQQSAHAPERFSLEPALLQPYREITQLLLACPDILINAVDHYGITALTWATQWDSGEILSLLLDRPEIEVNIVDGRGRTPLMRAASRGYAACVRKLLSRVDINAQDNVGETALIKAAAMGQENCVSILLEAEGIDATIKNQAGETALIKAASRPEESRKQSDDDEPVPISNGNDNIVRLLLPWSDVNAFDSYGKTALIKAAIWGSEPILRTLLDWDGVDVNARDDRCQTALIKAASWGHVERVDCLLAVPQIDINISDDVGETALVKAATRGHDLILKKLLSRPDHQPDLRTTSGRAIDVGFLRAALWGHLECGKLFLQHSLLDVNAKDHKGRTALMLATRRGHEEFVNLLLDHADIDVNAQSTQWTETALMKCLPILGHSHAHSHEDDDVRELRGSDTNVVPPEVYERIAKALLGHKDIQVNAKHASGSTAFTRAARAGHTGIVDLLLQTGEIAVNDKDKDGKTALMRASAWGHPEIVRRLVQCEDIDVHARDANGETALGHAAAWGHGEVVRLLIKEAGLEVDHEDDQGNTPLSQAVAYGQTECIHTILECSPDTDINAQDKNRRTPLMKAAARGRLEAINLLLIQPGLLVNLQDRNGETALMAAAAWGHGDIVLQLNKNMDVDVNMKDRHGNTALALACFRGRRTSVSALLERHDLNVGATDNRGDTALMKASSWGQTECVEVLLGVDNIDVNVQDGQGDAALARAAARGHRHIVDLLLQHGRADPNATNQKGETALMLAASWNHPEVVEAILPAAGAGVNAIDYRGQTPLLKASKHGYAEVVKILLSADDIAINQKDPRYGGTALMSACYAGHQAVVQVLLDGGADIGVLDRRLETAINKATSGGHRSIVQLLKTRSNRRSGGSGSRRWSRHVQ